MIGSAALLAALAALAPAADPVVPQVAGLLRDTRLHEISGMARSSQSPQRLWLHNDSGSRAQLFAIDTRGQLQASLSIAGVRPVDWEDMAAFEQDGRAYLLLGDVGDNGAVRQRSELVVIEEPAFTPGRVEQSLEAAPAWRIVFRYADGPRDVEAVGVDAPGQTVLLLTKRTSPPQVWSLPLRPPAGQEQVAQLRATLAVPDEATVPVDFQRRLQPGRPTALTIDAAGRRAAVLTYASIWLYERRDSEGWEQAFARRPQVFPIGLLAQAEAAAFDAQGRTLFATGERWPAPLLRWDLADVAADPR